MNPSLIIATPNYAFKKSPISNAVAPADMAAWKFEGNTSKTAVQVQFLNTTAAGATVWLTAFWFNPRKQSGPAFVPLSTNVQGEVLAWRRENQCRVMSEGLWRSDRRVDRITHMGESSEYIASFGMHRCILWSMHLQ